MHNEPDDAAPNTLSPRTTPTWELELLVFGATIFGLLQLPELLDHAYARALNLSPRDYVGMVSPLWMYAKFALITLLVTFIVHLCLRGYWVALVGLDSVYPGGIRWDRVEPTPLAAASARRQDPSMPGLIERADNRASRVFGVGFGFAMIMLMPVALVVVCLGLGLVVDAVAGPGHAGWVFGIVLAALMLPWAAARLLDKRIGARLDPDSGLGRKLVAVLGFYGRIGMGRGSNPLVALFVSHEGRLRAVTAAMLVTVPVLGFLLAQMVLVRGNLPLGFFVGLEVEDPTSPNASMAAFYSENASSDPAMLPLPRIRSRVATGPYLELFVPFLPRHHGPAMEATCPTALAVAREPQATRARLDCLAEMTGLQLDGKPLRITLDASSDAATGQPGMLAMVPIARLAAGRHELSLLSPARPGRTPKRYRIAFWK